MISRIFILIVAFAAFIYPQNDFKILSSNNNSIIFEYTPTYLDTSFRVFENKQFLNVEIKYGLIHEDNIWGTPAVPERRLNVGVPDEFGNSIKVLEASYIKRTGELIPIPKFIKENDLPTAVYEKSPKYSDYADYPELVSFGDFGISRGMPIQTIRIFPVKFETTTNTVNLYNRIVFQVKYSSSRGNGANQDDEMLKLSIINYDIAKSWIESDKSLKKKVVNSVLSTGEWIRFEAPEEGIYKIDRALLESFGVDPAALDPRTIKIYNNGGKVLPENVNEERPLDLVENAIIVSGESDGSFDASDYILFYGRGTNFWDYDFFESDNASGTIKRFNHPFSNKNYFWLTYGGEIGKRMEGKQSLNTVPDFVQTSTIAFADLEVDKINLAKSGREFFGDDFSKSISSRTYITTLNGRINSEQIKYKFRFINASRDNFTLKLFENSNPIFAKNLTGYSGDYKFGISYIESTSYTEPLPDNRSALKFQLETSSVTAIGYLDYFEITYTKELKAFDNKILFFSKDTTAIVEYYLNGFASSNIEVFDVTDHSDVKLITDHLLSGGDCKFLVNEETGLINKYLGIGNGQYLTPINPETVANSNLRGIQDGAKFIIISHKNFLEAANRLKEYRENEAMVPISTIVVDVEEIYNEFSGGSLDVSALRDFTKYVYDNWQIKPEYLLLFGKGTYDYKDIEGFGDNFIPTWQTQESLILILGGDSYTSDDFFSRLDGADFLPDIAIGRLTVRDLTEAKNYVDKVIYYEKSSDKGAWRNLITLIADDGIAGNERYEGSLHTAQSERLANVIIPPSYDFRKIYTADYPAVITGSGRRKPAANIDILDAMNQGTLWVNYVGHGNPDLWAHEHIFERDVAVPQLTNNRYFYLCAATCDFGYYDIPNFQSGAEEILFLPNSGSIATFNSARLVFSGANSLINQELLDNTFGYPRDTLNFSIPIGLSHFLTKIQRNSVNDRKFHLLGDPTLRLKIPQYFGSVDSINGQHLINDVQVKALSKSKIAGKILNPDSTKWGSFNGEGILTVFDSERLKLLEQIDNYPMVIQGGVIFRGRVSVNNGEFSADFVVPKDISYENNNGKIIFYFFDGSSDGLAFTNKIIVGGTDTTAVNDGEGPEIEIYFDDANYMNSYLVGPEPNLIVKLYDETGINTTGTGVGHKLEGILNEDEANPLDFTNFFTGELDAGGREGEINYQFNRLEEGDYSILVKAWDVFNNFSNESSFFTVLNTDDLVVRDIYNYPNPFKSNTTFTFQHNLNRPVDVRIKVYTIAGRVIKEMEGKNINQKFVKINWDGRDEDGDLLANGTYLYKLIVKTVDGEFSESVIGKMAVVK